MDKQSYDVGYYNALGEVMDIIEDMKGSNDYSNDTLDELQNRIG